MRYQNKGHWSGTHVLKSRGIIFALSLRTWKLTDKSHTYTGCQSDLYLECKYNLVIKNQLVWSLRNVFPNSSSLLTAHIQKFSPKFSENILQNLHTEGCTHKLFDSRFLFQHWTITITHHWWIRINRTYQNDHWTHWLKSPDSPVPDKMHRPALNLTCINGINKLQITSIRFSFKMSYSIL